MDKYRGQGNLADALRPTNRASSDDDEAQRAAMSLGDLADVDWQFTMQHDDCLLHGDGDCGYDFGDPFYNMKDPLLHELEMMTPNGLSFFGGSISEDSAIYPVEEKGGDLGGGHETFPCEIAFNCGPYVDPITSQSPQHDLPSSAMPFGSLKNPMARSEVINLNSRGRLIDTATAIRVSTVQKSSTKRRGYYRCSSSKGCPARKQVERSRTDPNMLVITYTSEHNHPWPTQRNPLAGSTRATQSANMNNYGNNAALKTSSASSPNKDQPPGDKRPNDVISQREAAAVGSSRAHIKEEMDATNSEALEEGCMTGSVPGKCDEGDDFLFQDLETMDGGGDPWSLLLNQGGKSKTSTAHSDSFGNFFDW